MRNSTANVHQSPNRFVKEHTLQTALMPQGRLSTANVRQSRNGFDGSPLAEK
jgi:hypothetical protein